MSSDVITVSRQRFDSKSYLLKVNRKEHVKPVLICNWKSCRFGDDVFLENKRIRKDRDKIKEVLAAKFEFENKDQNFHLLDNLEEDNLLEELKKIAQEIRTSGQRRPDMFVCFMFGFGGTDFFFDIRIDRTDSRKVTFKQIMDVFNGTNCPGLVMRPKLFFIQTERKKIDIPLSNLFHVYGSSPQYFGSMKSVPVESDFFVYSSTHIWEGDRSPFTDRLVEGFKIWDGQHDIMEVTLSVNKDIKNDMGQAFVPICTCQLTKQLKFFDFSKTDVDMQ